MKKVIYIAYLMFAIIISGLVAMYLTGRVGRGYKTLTHDHKFQISNTTQNIESVAKTYQPTVFYRKSFEKQTLLWTWYEIIEKENNYDIVYYHCWSDEINPNRSLNILYKIFRAAYFGWPFYDIEYFQLTIDKNNFKIRQIMFESSLNRNYEQEIVEHIINKLSFLDSIHYNLQRINMKGDLLDTSVIEPLQNDSSIYIGAMTWNHMSEVIDNRVILEYENGTKSNLRYLTDTDYRKYKFVRKSQGENKTPGGPVTIFITQLIFLFLLLFPLAKWIKKNNANRS